MSSSPFDTLAQRQALDVFSGIPILLILVVVIRPRLVIVVMMQQG